MRIARCAIECLVVACPLSLHLYFLFLVCLSPGESLYLTILLVTPNTKMSNAQRLELMGGGIGIFHESCTQYSELL